MIWLNKTHTGDCRVLLAAMALDGVRVQTCVTSPPYFGLRDYGHAGQIGLEPTPAEYVDQMVAVFRGVRDVLADDGTLWLNLGDSYAGSWGAQSRPGGTLSGDQVMAAPKRTHTGSMKRFRAGNLDKNGGASSRDGCGRVIGLKPKDLVGIPWMVAFALREDGWYLRSDIIWHKPNPLPESVTDRPTKAHEYLFLLAKSERYYYDAEAIKEDGSLQRSGNTEHKYVNDQQWHRTKAGFLKMHQTRYEKVNRRTVWTVTPQPQAEAHFACFPRALIEPCILAGAAADGVVLDPFMGSGTTARVAASLGRQFIGCELNAAYVGIQDKIGLQVGMAL